MESAVIGDSTGPTASVIIPAYESHTTVAATLGPLLDQARAIGAEVIVVDSSPGPQTADVVERFSEVRLERSAQRLLPHAARNLGVELAKGQILVFTDPDCIPAEGWLGRWSRRPAAQLIQAARGRCPRRMAQSSVARLSRPMIRCSIERSTSPSSGRGLAVDDQAGEITCRPRAWR